MKNSSYQIKSTANLLLPPTKALFPIFQYRIFLSTSKKVLRGVDPFITSQLFCFIGL